MLLADVKFNGFGITYISSDVAMLIKHVLHHVAEGQSQRPPQVLFLYTGAAL